MADIDLASNADEMVVVPKTMIKETGIGQQELVAALHACARAIYAICNNLDEDSATLGTDYLAKIGTPFADVLAMIERPHGTFGA